MEPTTMEPTTRNTIAESIKHEIVGLISKGLPINAARIVSDMYTLDLDEVSSYTSIASAVIRNEGMSGGVLFSSGYVKVPETVDGIIFTTWKPPDQTIISNPEPEPEPETLEDYEEIEIPPEITHQVFSLQDRITVYKNPKTRRIIVCKSNIPETVFGDGTEEVTSLVLEEFKISIPAKIAVSVNITDLHLVLLELPENKGSCLVIMNEPVAESFEGKSLRIPVSTIRQVGWGSGDTVYLYQNPVVQELLLTKEESMVHFTPIAEYSVHSDGCMQIPMRWLIPLNLHEVHYIRPHYGSSNTGGVDCILITPTTSYFAGQEEAEAVPIERSADAPPDDDDIIPF